MTWRLAVALAAGLALAPYAARAQEGLDQAESLAAAGRADDAREALLAWWDAEAAGAPRRAVQRALWLRGVLTVDPGQAALDYQRLVVEYPGGPFTDEALLRLAQAHRAAGRPDLALGHLRTLERDYPSSPHRLRARALIPEVEAAARRGPSPSPGPTASTGSAPSPAAAAPARTAGDAAEAEAATGPFAIQLGAFSTEERARGLVERAREAGLSPRLVRTRSSDLVRVRTERFPTREAADRRLPGIRARGFDALVVDDADFEEEVP